MGGGAGVEGKILQALARMLPSGEYLTEATARSWPSQTCTRPYSGKTDEEDNGLAVGVGPSPSAFLQESSCRARFWGCS